MRARLCCCGSNRIGSCCALPITLWVFSMPLLYFALLYCGIMYKDELKEIAPALRLIIQWFETTSVFPTIIMIIGLLFSLNFTFFLWSRVLLGVGIRYQILSAMDEPGLFLWKTCACIIPMNVRVGLHVDRAQGFEEPRRQDIMTIELSDQFVAPGQIEMA